MRKVYIQPKTKVYQVSQQTTLLTGSDDPDAQIGIGREAASTKYDVEVKKEADFFWN